MDVVDAATHATHPVAVSHLVDDVAEDDVGSYREVERVRLGRAGRDVDDLTDGDGFGRTSFTVPSALVGNEAASFAATIASLCGTVGGSPASSQGWVFGVVRCHGCGRGDHRSRNG